MKKLCIVCDFVRWLFVLSGNCGVLELVSDGGMFVFVGIVVCDVVIVMLFIVVVFGVLFVVFVL